MLDKPLQKIDRELYRAGINFVRKSVKLTNEKAIKKINKRGFIKSARVVEVTKIKDDAIVTLRADGARFSFTVRLNELDRVYGSPKAYAEKYI